jgi:hypothetical protein
LFPEELIDRHTNKATGGEISNAMRLLISTISGELNLAVPDYKDLSFDEVKCLITLNAHWGDFDRGTNDNFQFPAFAVLLSKVPEPKIFHLIQVIKIIRMVIENRYTPFSSERVECRVEYAHSVSNILDKSGIKPDHERQHLF